MKSPTPTKRPKNAIIKTNRTPKQSKVIAQAILDGYNQGIIRKNKHQTFYWSLETKIQ